MIVHITPRHPFFLSSDTFPLPFALINSIQMIHLKVNRKTDKPVKLRQYPKLNLKLLINLTFLNYLWYLVCINISLASHVLADFNDICYLNLLAFFKISFRNEERSKSDAIINLFIQFFFFFVSPGHIIKKKFSPGQNIKSYVKRVECFKCPCKRVYRPNKIKYTQEREIENVTLEIVN